MELETINLTDIIPSDYNPRKIDENEADKLNKSLQEYGLVDPIIINLKNNHIIGGHQRYDALLDSYFDTNKGETLHLLRLGDIGWVFTSTELTVKDETHEKALNLALNKISGEWDIPKLEPLLEELSLSGLDLDLTGFDETDLEELDLNSDSGIEPVEDEYVPPEDLKTEIQHGDIFRLGDHVLVCGDCTCEEDLKKLLTLNGGGV